MSAPKPADDNAEDDAEPIAALDAPTDLPGQPPGLPSDEAAAATVWVIAKPPPTEPCKADVA